LDGQIKDVNGNRLLLTFSKVHTPCTSRIVDRSYIWL